MNQKKIIVYPYDDQFTPVLRHRELLRDYEIVGLVAPKGWGLSGKDAGEADRGGYLGILVASDFDDSLDRCDAVLFCESRTGLEFEKYFMPKVLKAISDGKDIIFTFSLKQDIYDKIFTECDAHGVDFKYYHHPEPQEASQAMAGEGELLFYDIDVPVIFVLGIGERAHKFEIQLALRENITKMGYKVSQVGTRGYCELLGFHSFPSFMYGHAMSEINKIVSFNHFIKNLENEERSDLIIIGVPGGIMPFNNRMPNRFGILAYEVSQAVTPDSAVFSCHYSEYKADYFNKMADTLRYRLGCKVDCYNMSNVMVDWTNSKYEKRIIYTSLDSRFIDEKLKNYDQLDIPVFNVLNDKGAAGIFDCLINKLAEYGETECL
jgi:peptide maturation system protein (TIGR04066 family)